MLPFPEFFSAIINRFQRCFEDSSFPPSDLVIVTTLRAWHSDWDSCGWGASDGLYALRPCSLLLGFPVDGESWDGAVNQVGIFATGSGIAPIRSMIESGGIAHQYRQQVGTKILRMHRKTECQSPKAPQAHCLLH
eukprot:1277526-Amphidinium_carterae.1